MIQRRQLKKGLPILMYPGANLSDEEKAKIDNWSIDIEELTPDHIVYSLQNSFTRVLHSMLSIFEDFAGKDMAAKVAEEIGARWTRANWRNFLKSRGVERGTPELMAELQDIGHAFRGPVHIGALWAEFDDRKCIVRRKSCVYWTGHPEGTGQYGGALCDGFLRGYREADPTIEKIEHTRRLCDGDDGCEHIWWFKPL